MWRRDFLRSGAALAVLPASTPLWAQAYPGKPLRMVVPFIAGSAPDAIARSLSERLAAALGQPVVVENRGGAGGNIGFEAIARSAPDGYTLGLGTSSLSINPSLYSKVPYDPVADFVPVNLTFAMPHALVVQADSPLKTVADLVAQLKASPGKLNYASGGNGSGAHLCAEIFKAMSGTDAVHVPYRGAPEIVTAVMGSQAQFGFPTLSTVVPLVRTGKLRALGVTGSRRNAALPDVPSVGDTVKGFEVVSWFGVVVPAKTPIEVVQRVDQEVRKLLADAAFRERIQADGTEIVGMGHAEFGPYLRNDLQKWKQAVALSGARVD